MLAGRGRAVQHLAFAPVEARQMAARQRRPEHALAVDVAAARPIAGHWRLVDLGERRVGRIGSRVHANHITGISQRSAPDRAVDRVHRDRVEADDDALVLGRVDRLVGLDIIGALAVAVGVDDERRPPLRFLLVAGFLEHFCVEPADDRRLRTAGAGPQRIIGIVGEVQMVRREAGVDQRELSRRRIIHRQLAAGCLQRKHLRRGMARSLLAESRVCRRSGSWR